MYLCVYMYTSVCIDRLAVIGKATLCWCFLAELFQMDNKNRRPSQHGYPTTSPYTHKLATKVD